MLYNALYQEREDGMYFQCGEHWVHEALEDIIYSFKEEKEEYYGYY